MTTLTALALLGLLLASPTMAGSVRCTTYEERSMNRLQTICDDGTRAVSTYNRTLQRWDITITESPRQTCTARVHPVTKAVELRCR